MSAPTFGLVPEHLYKRHLQEAQEGSRGHGYDTETRQDLERLHASCYPAQSYGWGSWGYTVLRTVYTAESDDLFPAAIERLKRWIYYYCHYTRFRFAFNPAHRVSIENAASNEELWRRFHLDVIEDKENLAAFDGSAPEDFEALRRYFRQWIRQRARDLDLEDDSHGGLDSFSARFSECLIITSDSLASLGTMSEPPPIRNPATIDERAEDQEREGDAWLWLLDDRLIANREQHNVGDFPGWVRITPEMIRTLWFLRAFRSGTDGPDYDYKEKPAGSGICYGKPL